MIKLEFASKSDPDIQNYMAIHYSHPRGFVGRQIMYRIWIDGVPCGAIAGGSATQHLPNRNEFFGDNFQLQQVINNTFYHLENATTDRNVGTKILKLWRKQVVKDWQAIYQSPVIGFETLVELPRDGALYKADNWTLVGVTKGFTCKREAGRGNERWGGIRVWNHNDLKPKLVFCKLISKSDKCEFIQTHRKLF